MQCRLVESGGRAAPWPRIGRRGVVGARAVVGVAALLAVGATLGSLYLSEIAHLEPCRWCWFQRIAMYPLALVLVVGWLRRDRGVHLYGLPMCLAGAAMSTWHYLLQHFPDLEGATTCSLTSPCTVRYAWEFGFVVDPLHGRQRVRARRCAVEHVAPPRLMPQAPSVAGIIRSRSLSAVSHSSRLNMRGREWLLRWW